METTATENLIFKSIIITTIVITTLLSLNIETKFIMKFLEVIFLIPSSLLFYNLISNDKEREEDLKAIHSFIK